MATSYTSLLGFALPVTGELAGTWGDTVNNSITQLVEDSVAGVATASVTAGNWTLTTTGSGASNQARCAILIPTGSPGVSRNIIAPSQSKAYIVINQSDAAVVLKGAATTGVTIAAGSKSLVAWNGSDFVEIGQAGDVDGPSSSTDNAVVRFDGTTGKLLQNSAVTIADTTGDITGGKYNGLTVSTTTGTFTLTNAKTLAVQNTLTLAGTDSTTMTFPSTSTTVAGLGIAQTFTQDQTISGNLTMNAQGDVRFADSDSSNWVAFQGPATVASNVTWTLPSADGSNGQVLTTNGSGTLSWVTNSGGDVTGPASSTDTAVALFDGTTGKLLKNSAVTVGSTGNTVISGTDNTNAMLRITQEGSGNALVVEDSANPDSTPLVIDANGKLITGNTSALFLGGGTTSPQIQIQGTGSGDSSLAAIRYSANTSGSYLFLDKSRGSLGSQGVVLSGDTVGNIDFRASDGTDYLSAGRILVEVDGTPGTNDMPGRLVFSTTADGASSPTERMRISSAGNVGIGATPSAAQSLVISKQVSGGTTGYQIVINGQVQSGVVNTNGVAVFNALSSTAAITNLATFSANQGTFAAGYTATNQFGYYADSTLTGATNNYGFYSNIASGTGRWNFYANGTADNYFAGAVGIGDTSFSGWGIKLGGNRSSNNGIGIGSSGTIQSGVTGSYVCFSTYGIGTAAASFTLGTLTHFGASQSTIGLNSTVTTQVGFTASSNLTGATNNYGFYGDIASGSNRWNLYMNGTAENYLGGNLKIGGTAARATTAGTNHLCIFNGTAPAGTLTNGVTLYSASGDFNFMDSGGNGFKVGFRNIPAVGTKTAGYTLAVADVGKYVQLGSSGAITIPDATFAEGDVISIFNNTATTATITCSITTAYIAGTDSDKATMTLASRGVATILFISSTVCVVSGNVT